MTATTKQTDTAMVGGQLALGSSPATAPPLPQAALETLAARFRPGGLFLVALHADGSIAYHDPAAGLFFQRFVLPMLQFRQPSEPAVADRAAAVHAGSGVEVWNLLPGVAMAAFPYVERRQVQGILLLAGKACGFRLSEEVVRICSRLGIDGIWLNQQAESLAGYDDELLVRHARLLLSMVRDQVRLSHLEQELDSLSGQLANTYEELSLIYQLGGGMKVNRSTAEFFRQACLEVMDLIGARGMGVSLARDVSKELKAEVGGGSASALFLHPSTVAEPVLYGAMSLPPGAVQRLARQLTQVLGQRRNPLLINHLNRDRTFNWLAEHAHQLLAVPLQRQEQLLGCLFALDKLTGEFDTVDCKLLCAIANESAIFLENSMLYEDARGLMMGLLHSLVSAVDAKDTYTCGHSERVALLSRMLAQQANLGERFAERVYMAGLLHDVGKIGVPEAVLQKTGRLTPEEYDQIKKHPEIGARILRDIRQIEDIIPGVLHHHERYDGKGYPAGLAAENIPLIGRVICLADCFDAMTSSRTYRKALPLEVALTEIRRCSGTQFDPELTDAFLRIRVERFRELLASHQPQSLRLAPLTAGQPLRAAG